MDQDQKMRKWKRKNAKQSLQREQKHQKLNHCMTGLPVSKVD